MKHLNGAKIKSLQVLISKLELQRNEITEESKILQSKKDQLTYQVKKYKEELSQLKQSATNLLLSEHATLRYLQRVYKLDMQKIEDEIITDSLVAQASSYGNGIYVVADEFRVKIVDNVIVTILEK